MSEPKKRGGKAVVHPTKGWLAGLCSHATLLGWWQLNRGPMGETLQDEIRRPELQGPLGYLAQPWCSQNLAASLLQSPEPQPAELPLP